MARRVSPSQLRSQLRQAQSKQRQALNKFKSDARKLDRAVSNYNSAVRQHNAKVRTNQARLQRELRRLSSTSTRTVRGRVTFHTSVVTVQQSFQRVENLAATGRWVGDQDLLDIMEGEAANSAATWNVLAGEAVDDGDTAPLSETRITDELASIDSDFDARWRGALFSLSPANPDAARHFCTSARELVDRMLVRLAPDEAVTSALPDHEPTEQGTVSRRARIRYCLVRAGRYSPEVHDFADADLENVVQLFAEFNKGTHGSAGRFSIGQLGVMKRRVEDALLFLHRIAC